MGIGNSDLIAIAVTTSYDGSGASAARTDLKGLADAGKQATGALADLANAPIQSQIGAFQALGKQIDVTNVSAVQGYRAQGDALAANLAHLGATDTEHNQIGASITKVERAAGASLFNPNNPNQIGLTALPNKTRTAANGIAQLAQAAVTGGGSVASLTSAVGNLSAGLGTLATSAKAVAAATWITLLIQAAAIAVGAFEGWKKKTRELNTELGDLQSTGQGLSDTLGGADLAAKIQQINHAADDEIKKLNEVGLLEKATDAAFSEHARQRLAIAAQIRDNQQKAIDLARTQYANDLAARAKERNDLIASTGLELKLEQDRAAGRMSDMLLAREQLEIQTEQRDAEIRHQFVRRSASGEIIPLNAQELLQLGLMLGLNREITNAKQTQLGYDQQIATQNAKAQQLQQSSSLQDQFKGRREEIELTKAAEIKATGDVLTATLRAEQAKRRLMTESAAIISRSWLSLGAEIVNSMNTAIEAGKSLKGVLLSMLLQPIAAELHALAESEAVKAVAHFATGDIGGGIAHTAASGLATAAAARVASWGGGGGPSGSGGGAGAGAVGGGPTFTPRDQAGAAATVVNLYTSDPFGRENIMIASYQLQRAGTLNRPIYLPPTTGLRTAGNN